MIKCSVCGNTGVQIRDSEKQKDICLSCFFKAQKKEDKEMGKLADRAKEKSPYLRLEIGESTPVLVYKSWKETTDNFGNDTFRYYFDLNTENGIVTKQFDNMSQAFAEAMDVIEFGTKVILTREQKLDKDGDPVENKSTWAVKIA